MARAVVPPRRRLYRRASPGERWWFALLLVPALLTAAVVYGRGGAIESQLQGDVETSLQDAGLSGTTVEMNGRKAVVHVPTGMSMDVVAEAAQSVDGVAEVRVKHVVRNAAEARACEDLQTKIDLMRRGAPAEAVAEAVVLDRLAAHAEAGLPASTAAAQIVSAVADPIQLMLQLRDTPSLYLRVLEVLREVRREDWAALFGKLLPTAPIEACDPIAKALLEAGHAELVAGAVAIMPNDFSRHLDAVCWLWRGPESVRALRAGRS